MALTLSTWEKIKAWYYKDDPLKPCFNIHGYKNCKYFEDAKCAALEFQRQNPDIRVNIVEVPLVEWNRHLAAKKIQLEAYNHRTSPIVFTGCNENTYKFVGGCDNFLDFLKQKHNFESEQCPVRDAAIYLAYRDKK
eukprot:CAMPEP_0168555308 /NCGR_PEP_ID=MMETSP0413-20121227/8260_1 /TAXON_ID=136452 /ORGANISM="Filamoeba nolandi, Strain NC-AS-23-1" /LENGTH=135 /DNA_ID=CAMNT_0008586139 /DNA_START=286 /DNA_END=693 /DNA_ORIENTATION=+